MTGDWKNNIVCGHSNWGFDGIRGEGRFNVELSYNCVYDNFNNWSGNASQGTGSFSEDPLFVDIDGIDDTLGCANYADDDFHIQSEYGSYHFGDWTNDANTSPCVDTGDPVDDYSNEPEDNGDRINIGAYGNTDQASLSGEGCPLTMIYKNFPDSTWVMMGVPLAPENDSPMEVYGDDFGGDMPFEGDYNWSLIRWQTEQSLQDTAMEYYEYGDGTEYQPPDCSPGIAHFVWQNHAALLI